MIESDYLREAYKYASRYSDDPRTQNAAILVLNYNNRSSTIAANKLPRGLKKTPEQLQGKEKYAYIEHAERGVIYRAAALGYCTHGSTMYCPWFACADCARAIVEAGVSRVVGLANAFKVYDNPSWQASIDAGNEILDAGGVKREYVEGSLGGCSIIFDGKVFTP